jgi:hypothetical protein
VNHPLPWERLLWSRRPLRIRAWLSGERYYLTDFRLIRESPCCADELALQDVGEVGRTESRFDRLLGTSTVVVHARRQNRPPFVVADVRGGTQLAAVLELLASDSSDSSGTADADAIRSALTWEPRAPAAYREAAGAICAVILSMVAVVLGLHGRASVVTYAADDVVRPNGVKRSATEIARFMELDVMPWARTALGRVVGGADRVTCETCHGSRAELRNWAMPAVAALPEPDVIGRGFEIYSAGMDAQMRNAIYGYLSESENSAKAAYMREVVMPGMAALLRRAPYDFTRSYEVNRSRNALGCYHCHRVK